MAEPSVEASPKGQDRLRLTPMAVPKGSDVLAEAVRERILRGDFPEGTALPAERDMVAQTQMSRSTVREALRILEAQGLIKIKAGRSGGAYVQKPGRGGVADSVELLIRGRQIRLADLLQTREAIEPYCARLAALNRTDTDLERLDSANDAIALNGSLEAFLQANLDWHLGVALAGQNELLIGFMSALGKSIYRATLNEGFVDDEVRRETTSAHRSITNAIRRGNAETAVRRMTSHVHTYAQAALAVEKRTTIPVDED